VKGLVRLHVSAGFLLLAGALWLLDSGGVMSALLPAAAVHELGHIAAIAAMGGRIEALWLEASGLRLDYRGVLGRGGEAFAAAAGPAAGLLLALAAAAAGKRWDSDYLKCLAGVSCLLSGFNLLPALPLDGGRILLLALEGLWPDRAEDAAFWSGLGIGAGLMLLGLWAAWRWGALALIPAGAWVLLYQLRLFALVKNAPM